VSEEIAKLVIPAACGSFSVKKAFFASFLSPLRQENAEIIIKGAEHSNLYVYERSEK
jgi:hypothetical protein